MKKKLLIVFSIAALIVFGLLINTNDSSANEMDKLREQHIAFLDKSPFKETEKLSKKERKLNGLPPNKYMERQFELTMDPEDGRPHPERMFATQEALAEQFFRVPGENTNDWVERGPDNIGGRTRAIMYDPNDTSGTRVFAGGVSGGLWVNDDITNAASAWSLIGIPNNLAVSVITHDPNNTDIFYVGTGESYVFDSVNGNGVWQSTDAGVTWAKIFGGVTGEPVFQANAKITVNTPAGISGEYPVILATAFGDQLGSAVTGDLVLVQDGTGVSEDACEALTNDGDIAGKIAVIRRGDCSFVDKINRAQTAGAIGVIMVNNIPSNPISMGGTDAGITIPNVMISRDFGNVIIAELGSGVNATMELSGNLLSGSIVPGVQHINDIKIRDNGGTSEVYVAVGSNGFYDSNPRSYLGLEEAGLYMSNDEGTSFSKLALGDAPSGLPLNPSDVEISVDNTIWVSTTANRFFGDGGGLIFSSTDGGVTFTQSYAISGTANRTHIAVSGTNAGTIFILSYRGGGDASPVFIAKTVNAFGRVSNMSQPNSIDGNIPDNDFTNTQGWFNYYLEVDPTDDNILYVGGIDIFRSGNGGASWSQISEAYTGTSNLSGVHPDNHTIVLDPSDPNKAIFGNDGGIFYAGDLANASTSETGLTSRNTNYNITQFYKGAIGQDVANEKILGGAQDNNSLLMNNATAGINSADVVQGGDGAYCFIDRDNEYMVTSSQNGNFYRANYTTGNLDASISGGSVGGQFINPAALDSANDILYMDGTTATPTYQILRYSNLDATPSAGVALSNGLLVRNPTAFKTSTFTTTTLFVGTDDGKLLKLSNADASPTWSDITGPNFAGSVSCIELGATENDMYVTFYNYGVISVFYSSDGGTTWSNKEGNLPDIPTRAILSNPLNADEVILGTELGVWATNNFSDTTPVWHQAQNGMKDVQVTSFDLRTADNTVLASTYGRGMFTGQFTADASGLSVDEFSENDLIKIYPTVSNGEMTVSSISEVREGVISVFDINGRTVHTSKLNFEGGIEQPLSVNLASGMYVVKFSANELQSSHKIIIK